jgi:DNA helicase-2/ATP-dependent DNA helicase PcrA
VNLMTYHRAKGLEFDAVFLPRLLDGELPYRAGRNRAPLEEERRLLYVGITRARRYLSVTWPGDTRARPSPFVAELLGGPPRPSPGPARAARATAPPPANGPLFDSLKRWRLERARRDSVPPYVVFHDATLSAICERRPQSLLQLQSISGIGPAKLERYGEEVLAVVAGAANSE